MLTYQYDPAFIASSYEVFDLRVYHRCVRMRACGPRCCCCHCCGVGPAAAVRGLMLLSLLRPLL